MKSGNELLNLNLKEATDSACWITSGGVFLEPRGSNFKKLCPSLLLSREPGTDKKLLPEDLKERAGSLWD